MLILPSARDSCRAAAPNELREFVDPTGLVADSMDPHDLRDEWTDFVFFLGEPQPFSRG